MKIFTTLALIAPLACFSADLTTVTGKTYKNYSVRRVTEKGIQIMHAQGGCIVPFEQLPDDVRAKYRSQEEKILAEQRQKKLEEEKQERLRKLRAARDKLLKNLELISYDEIKVSRVVDAKTCVCYFTKTGQDLIVTGIDTTNIADWGILPCLDKYFFYNHNFYASFTKKNGKITLDPWKPRRCLHCGMEPPKTADKRELTIALYNLENTPCPKTGTGKRHRLFYVGMRVYRNTKYMVFTVNRKMAVKFAKANPTVNLPKLKEPRVNISTPAYQPAYRSVPQPRFRPTAVPAVNANSMEAQMLQSRTFY